MNKFELLSRLPDDVVVLDCAHCGRLMTASKSQGAWHKVGLRRMGGRIKGRPHCAECMQCSDGNHDANRSQAQTLKMRRYFV